MHLAKFSCSQQRYFTMLPYAWAIIGICFVALQSYSIASAQLTEVENALPKTVPLKVEFKGYDQEKWWYSMEAKITNVGKKPIFFLHTYLELNALTEYGNNITIGFKFGDPDRLFSDKPLDTDSPLLPGESYILKVVPAQADAWDLGHRTTRKFSPTRGEFRLAWLNFGDGASMDGGGTTTVKKARLDKKP